ncbi:MAG: hypothetical protein SF172_07095 [Burkholderiales bacterium]|nr:hypothetical protein [Burkholderiales bacterium]
MTSSAVNQHREKRPAKLRRALWGAVALLLLAPLVAMQFTNEVNWTLADFVVFGCLLAITGLACELAVRKIHDQRWRIGALLVIAIGFLLAWAQGAVGIFG